MIVNFVQTNGGIRDVKLIRPGYPADKPPTFSNSFLKAIRPFSVLRFMDWSSTNNRDPLWPAETDWSDRKLTTDATQKPFGKKLGGVAWEYVIELANLTGKDIWVNIPASASDGYVQQLAKMMHDQLNPGITIYLEYSNEVWNGLFGQTRWNSDAAADEHFNDPDSELNYDGGTFSRDRLERRRVAQRLIQISQIFANEFGQGSLNKTIRPVLAWWTIFQSQYRDQLEFIKNVFGPPSQFVYGIAAGTYYSDFDASEEASVDDLLDALEESSDSDVSDRTSLKNLADEYGVQLFAYEGGPDSGGTNMPDPVSNVGNRILAQRHPRMKEILLHDLEDNWFGIGGKLYMYFTLSSAYGRWGMWGLTEDITRLDSPKFEAIYELVGGTTSSQATGATFPQYVDGQGNQTRVVLKNNSSESDGGAINFMDNTGQIVDSVGFDLGPWSSLDVETDGSGQLTSGVIQVESERGASSSIEGTQVFQVLGSYVSVDASPVRRTHQVYVSMLPGSEKTGVALYNPHDSPVTLTAVLLNGKGARAKTKLIEIQPGEQLMGFIDEHPFFDDYFSANPSKFRGTMNLSVSTDSGIAAVGLIQKADSGALLAVSTSSQIYQPEN
jgi:predicted outer membrane repeat protein